MLRIANAPFRVQGSRPRRDRQASEFKAVWAVDDRCGGLRQVVLAAPAQRGTLDLQNLPPSPDGS
jgi:hypothetical protein